MRRNLLTLAVIAAITLMLAGCRADTAPVDPADPGTDDPGEQVFHHKAILAGTSQQGGRPANVGGVAPLDPQCRPINNVISLSFANSLRADWRELCWTVAQESAHAFGLDHAFDCHDPMTYLPACGRQFFRDRRPDLYRPLLTLDGRVKD
jgi:hypothetical protein